MSATDFQPRVLSVVFTFVLVVSVLSGAVGPVAGATADRPSVSNGSQSSITPASSTGAVRDVEPRISDVSLYLGPETDGPDVTGTSLPTDVDVITVQADWNFASTEGVEVVVENQYGVDITNQVDGTGNTISSSGDATTLTDVHGHEVGEYTITVRGVDQFRDVSRSVTFTLRDPEQRISLARAGTTQSDDILATVTGTPGEEGLVRIAERNLSGSSATETTSTSVFTDTDDIVKRIGTRTLGGTDGQYVGAFVALDGSGSATVRIDPETFESPNVDIEFVELYGYDPEPELTAEEMREAFDADLDAVQNTAFSAPSTVYLGDTDVDLRDVGGVEENRGESIRLMSTVGTGARSITVVDDVASADISRSDGFRAGTAYNVSGDVDGHSALQVVQPQVFEVALYNGGSTTDPVVTGGAIRSQQSDLTVEATWNFASAEQVAVTIEDESGRTVQSELGGSKTIDTSGGSTTLSGIDALEPGEYTVTVGGADDLDGTSHNTTFTIINETNTITLAQSTIIQGDTVVGTATGTPGTVVHIRIEQDDLEDDYSDPTDVFANTGDVDVGPAKFTDSQGTDWVAAVLGFGDDGKTRFMIRTSGIATGSAGVELAPGADINNDAEGSTELTVEEKFIDVTSAPDSVPLYEEFTIEGTAPQSHEVKAYAKVNGSWHPLYDDDGDFSADDVVSDGQWSVDVELNSREIDPPGDHRIAVVADPVDRFGNQLLDSYEPIDQYTYEGFDTRTSTVLSVTPPEVETLVVDPDRSDAYDTIQAAVDAASSGDTVEVRPGTYREEVTVDKNVTLTAPEGATLDGATLRPEANGIRIPSDSPVSPTIVGFTVAGYEDGIAAYDSKGAWMVRNVTIRNTSDNGLDADDTTGDWTARNLTIENTTAYAVDTYRASGDWTATNLVVRNSQGGVNGADSTGDWRVADSRIVGTDIDGFYLDSASGEWGVSGTIIANNGDDGIETSGSSGRWTVDSSSIRLNDGLGIEADNATRSWEVTDTEFTQNGGGIYGYNTTGAWTVRDSTFENQQYYGLYVEHSTGDWKLLNTRVANNSFAGVDADNSTGDWAIRDSVIVETSGEINLVNRSGRDLIQLSGDGVSAAHSTGDWTVENSVINRNQLGVMAGDSEGAWTVENTELESNQYVGVQANLSTGNWAVRGSSIVNHSSTGIFVRYASGAWTVENSTLAANGGTVTFVDPDTGAQETLLSHAVDAFRSSGQWRVRNTTFVDNAGDGVNAVNASDATIEGNATRNWWGQETGPTEAQCVGNVDCSDWFSTPDGEREISLTSAPTLVRGSDEVTIRGRAPDSDVVKAYINIDRQYVPLVNETGTPSEDAVDDGVFSVDVDLGRTIASVIERGETRLAGEYTITVVADPVDEAGNDYLSDELNREGVDADTFGEFDTTKATTVRSVGGDLTVELPSSAVTAGADNAVILSGTALGQGGDVRVYLVGPDGDYLDTNGNSQAAEKSIVFENEFDKRYKTFDTPGEYTFVVVGRGYNGQYASDLGFGGDSLQSGLTRQQAVDSVEDSYTGAESDDQIVVLTLQATSLRPDIDDTSLDIDPFPVSTDEAPTISVNATGATDVFVDLTVDGREEQVPMENTEGDRWEVDLSTVDSPNMDDLERGTKVELAVVACNEQCTESRKAVLDRTDQAYPESELPTSDEMSEKESQIEQKRPLHYFVFDQVVEIPVILVTLDEDPSKYGYGSPSAVVEWEKARQYDINSYFGSDRGTMGSIGFDLVYHDNETEFYRINSKNHYANIYNNHGGGGKSKQITTGELTLDAKKKASSDVTVGNQYIVTHPGVAPDDLGANMLNADSPKAKEDGISGKERVYALMNEQDHYGVWAHEISHLHLGLIDTYPNSGYIQQGIHSGLMSTNEQYGTPKETLPSPYGVITRTKYGSFTKDLYGLSVSDKNRPWATVNERSLGTAASVTVTAERSSEIQIDDTVEVIDVVGGPKYAFEINGSGIIRGYNFIYNPINIYNPGLRQLHETTSDSLDSGDRDHIDGGLFADFSVNHQQDSSIAEITVELVTNGNREVARMQPLTSTTTVAPNIAEQPNVTTPDADLRAIDSQGRVTGVTEDGEFINEIPGANASGDRVQGPEWISVPADADVEYEVSTADAQQFVNETNVSAENATVSYTLETTEVGENPQLVTDNGTVRVTNTTTTTTNTTVALDVPNATPPEITGFEMTAEEDTLMIGFSANASLPLVETTITDDSDSVIRTLTREDFTETGSGPYAYEATVEVTRAATYTATLDRAAVGGADGATGQTDTATVDLDRLVVDADNPATYDTIEAAIDDTTPGDTVEVRPGTYEESITIPRQLTLVAPDGATLSGTEMSIAEAAAISVSDDLRAAAWTVEGFSIEGYPTGIGAANTSGDWTVRNVTVDGTGVESRAAGIAATNTSGDWLVVDSTVQRHQRGIDAMASSGAWRVRDSTVVDNDADGIRAVVSTGDWAVESTTTERNDGDGVDATRSLGAWTVANSTVDDNGADGIRARGDRPFVSAGAWAIRNATITDNIGAGIDAKLTTAEWTVHESVLASNDGPALTVENAPTTGSASRNYWGTSEGPTRDEVVGNVTVETYYEDASLRTLAPLAPTISEFSLTNPTAQTLRVTVDASARLTALSVPITDENGRRAATLSMAEFGDANDGEYGYVATVEVDSAERYSGTLETAVGVWGNDGAAGQTDRVEVSAAGPTLVSADLHTGVNNVGSPIVVNATATTPDGALTGLELIFDEETRDSGQCSGASCEARLSTTVSESTWNTTAKEYDTVELTVVATDAAGDMVSTTVETPVYIRGDVNGDGQVNIFDAVAVGRAWKTTRGSPDYSAAADLNNDGRVDIFDAVIVGRNWQDTAGQMV